MPTEADGTESGWHGECLELDAPHRLVAAEVVGLPDAVAANTARFTDEDGGTHLVAPARTSTDTSTPVWNPACRSRLTGSDPLITLS